MSPSIFPTIGQINFVNNYCAQLLQRSLTTHNFLGTGRDDVLTIRIITSLTRNQLIGVDQFYRTIKNPQNQSLPAKLETWGGSCGHFLSALSQSIESFHASLLNTALDGFSCDTAIINEIFCLRSHQELSLIIDSFTRKYNFNIRDRLQSRLKGKRNHIYLLTKLLQSGRVEDQATDETLASQQAALLKTILEKTTATMLGGGLTDEATLELIDLILTFSFSQAQIIKKQFEIQNPSCPSLENLITQRVGGGLQDALLLLLSIPTAVYARKIMEACNATGLGGGGSEEVIWRIIGGHNVDDVAAIAQEYERNFNADLRTIIRTRVTGNFRDALVSYLEHCPHPQDYSEGSLLNYILTLDVFTLAHFSIDTQNILEVLCNRSKKHLSLTNDIYRHKNNGQTLGKYLSGMRGKERRMPKRFLKYLVLEDVEVDARSLRKGLNLAAASPAGGDDDDTNTSGSVDKRAIIESLCGKSPERLVAARELYERLYDANFLQNLVNSLQDDAILSEIVSALVAHNRHEVMERTDYDGGSAEALAAEIETCLNDLTPENLQELAMSFLTHSLTQLKHTSQVYEKTYHKSLEREINLKLPNLIGVALNSLALEPAEFLARQIHAHIKDSETINRLIGGTEKTLMFEVVRVYREYFREDLVAEIAKAYPNQEEYVAYVTAWITMPEIPFLLDRVE